MVLRQPEWNTFCMNQVWPDPSQADQCLQRADVAASWTSMAFVKQRVRNHGFWVTVVFSWSVQRSTR